MHKIKQGHENFSQDASNFIWNSIGGVLNAGQSVLILMVITRVCGLEAAGIFSIAYATGNLFLYLGNYGVRNYQVSDLNETYSFSDYVFHRMATVFLMLAISVFWSAASFLSGSYSAYKSGCVLAMCLLKSIDCLEEVFEGRYQQKGRLDRSGKLVTFRLVVSIGGMCVALIVTKNLLVSTWISVALAAAASLCCIAWYKDTAEWTRTPFQAAKVTGLMRECFPVCASNFLSFLLINEPKYAIDAVMDETAQACYNFIAMPVFVIQLLNMFMYQPLLIRMTQSYEKRNRQQFLHYFGLVFAGLFAITLLVLAVGWIAGIPVLSLLYATDLSSYKIEFMILLVGGIFLACNGFFCAVLTLMRSQKKIPVIYFAGSIFSLVLTPRMVRFSGINGACVSFVLVMMLVTAFLTLLFVSCMKRDFYVKEKQGK